MQTKKVKKLCSVKGCKNTDSYAISAAKGEFGGVIICEECLRAALDAIKNGGTATTTAASAAEKGLFYHPSKARKNADITAKTEISDEVLTVEVDTADEATPIVDVGSALICPVCGKECKSELGLRSHLRSHDSAETEASAQND